jgi:hypothetical protein
MIIRALVLPIGVVAGLRAFLGYTRFFDDFVQGVVRRCREARALAAPPLLLAGGSTSL